MKDKNGKEIHENDFLEIYLLGPVETSRPSYGIVKVIDDEFVIETAHGIWGFDYAEVEIIGNTQDTDILYCNYCKTRIALRQNSRYMFEKRKSIDASDYFCFSCRRKLLNGEFCD